MASPGGPARSASASPFDRYAIHGLSVDLSCRVGDAADAVSSALAHVLGPFAMRGVAPATTGSNGEAGPFVRTSGSVLPYQEEEVLRHLSPTAVPISGHEDLIELYQERERFWMVDERWGLAAMNLLRGQFRSWVLPRVSFSAPELVEGAVLWPLAQLLRGKGLHLLPAISVVRDGWAALVLCPFNMEPELTALVRSGYRVIGQRWTALRQHGTTRVELLHMPGQVARMNAGARALEWVDLTSEYCGVEQHRALCDAVVMIEPGRRPQANITELDETAAAPMLRTAWPIPELHPQRRHGQMAAKLARTCRCATVRLSRNPQDLMDLLMRLRRPYAARVQVQLRSAKAGLPGTAEPAAATAAVAP
jgi:hypothetical protein